jgi:beta-glucanase (GH16 family)
MIRKLLIFGLASLAISALFASAETVPNGRPVDSTKWFHQTILPNGKSWHNQEQQHYTNRLENAYVSDGLLKIKAKKETFKDQGVSKKYTSARLNSKFAFTYGRVEVRAKLPKGHGTWPAIWMLPKNISEAGAYFETQGFGNQSWPDCGEIDILEHWGKNQNHVQSAIHTRSSHGNTINLGGQRIPTISSEFHIYTLDWTAEKLLFSVDGKPHYTYSPAIKNQATWPFDSPQYVLLNFAIEKVIDSGFTEATFDIDYVRIYDTTGVAVFIDEFN